MARVPPIALPGFALSAFAVSWFLPANVPVTAVAGYKTTDTTKTATTDGSGSADIPFSISASSGYTVKVDVNVAGQESCTTQFAPQ